MFDYSLGHGEVMMQRFKQRATTDGSRFVEPLLPKAGVVVDIGCGNGTLASWVANSNMNLYVIGIDKELNQLSLMQPEQGNLSYIESDAYVLPLADNCIDLIYLHAVCMYLNPLERVLKECQRVLKVGGKIALRNGLSVINNMELFTDGPLLSKILNNSLERNHDNPNVAFEIPHILKSNQFIELSTNTSIETSHTIEQKQLVADSCIELLDGRIGQCALREKVVNQHNLDNLKYDIKIWSVNDKAYNKAIWLEHVFVKMGK